MRAFLILSLALSLPIIASAARIRQRIPAQSKDSKGSRKLVYGGCFCPPHKGHFAQLQHLNEEYDEIFIFMYGDAESRHGYHPQINEQIWNIFKSTLPDGGAKVTLLPNGGSIVSGEPYLTGTYTLAQLGRIRADDTLTIAVGDDYDEERVASITGNLNSITQPLGVTADVIVMDRSTGGKTSATEFCQSLDANAYQYGVGSPIMYTSLSGNGKHPGIVESVGNGTYTVKLDIGVIKQAYPQQIGPGPQKGDCVKYTSQSGRGKFEADVEDKQMEAYQVSLRWMSTPQVKTASPDMIEPCSKVLDPKKFSVAGFKDKFLPETLNEQQLAAMQTLLLKKNILG